MPKPSPAPRGATEADRQLLRDLVGEVFRPSLTDEYPQLFHEANLNNCRVVEVDGALVSHVGMTTIQDAAIYGCRVRVACIGGVATRADYRGAGYAGACLDDAISVALADGVDFMMVSGDRSLYRRAGCRHVGEDHSASLSAETAAAAPRSDLRLRDATTADIPILRALHHAEPTHWKRDPATWRRALECGWVMNRKSRFVIADAHGTAAAYFILPDAGDQGATAQVSEYAGDRVSLAQAFVRHVSDGQLSAIRWHVAGHDTFGRAVAQAAGADLHESMTSGTYIILDPPQLVERMGPYLREYLGEGVDTLRVTAAGDGFHVGLGGVTHSLPDRGCTAHFLFGTREERPTPAPIPELLAEAFALPSLWYGVNYV